MKRVLLLLVFQLVSNILTDTSEDTSSDEQDRFIPFEGFGKCYVAAQSCPNTNITFHLYTRNTSMEPHQLDIASPETISEAKFIRDRPLKILIHGYTGHKDFSPNTEIRPAFFQHDEYNIISVDYHPLAPEPCYVQAVQNLPVVGNCTAQLIDYLIQESIFKLENIHVIGFSLGAQTAGMVANFVKSGKLKRITGLDPAKPLFIFAKHNRKLGKDDAEFVDVIHTDVFQRGILAPAGHADFYVNGGIEQPGCKFQTNESTGSCNHVRAPEYFAESINSRRGFWGFKCKDWIQWAFGLCQPAGSDELALMGAYASMDDTALCVTYYDIHHKYTYKVRGSNLNVIIRFIFSARGLYFLNTNVEPPFAEGILPEFTISDENNILNETSSNNE